MKIAICDDEKRDIKRLVSLLEKYSKDRDYFRIDTAYLPVQIIYSLKDLYSR